MHRLGLLLGYKPFWAQWVLHLSRYAHDCNLPYVCVCGSLFTIMDHAFPNPNIRQLYKYLVMLIYKYVIAQPNVSLLLLNPTCMRLGAVGVYNRLQGLHGPEKPLYDVRKHQPE